MNFFQCIIKYSLLNKMKTFDFALPTTKIVHKEMQILRCTGLIKYLLPAQVYWSMPAPTVTWIIYIESFHPAFLLYSSLECQGCILNSFVSKLIYTQCILNSCLFIV